MTEDRNKVLTLTDEEQLDAFQDAAAAIANDVEDGVIDADTWGDEPTAGEIVRVASEAYAGTLSVDA
jgi:hypothetical protein